MAISRRSLFVLPLAALMPGLAQAQSSGDDHAASLEHYCAPEHGKFEREGKLSEALVKHLNLNDAQKAALKDFEDTRVKAIEKMKSGVCASRPDLTTFESHLKLHEKFLEDRLEVLREENPKLIAFYNSLDADQKAKFDAIRAHSRRQRH